MPRKNSRLDSNILLEKNYTNHAKTKKLRDFRLIDLQRYWINTETKMKTVIDVELDLINVERIKIVIRNHRQY